MRKGRNPSGSFSPCAPVQISTHSVQPTHQLKNPILKWHSESGRSEKLDTNRASPGFSELDSCRFDWKRVFCQRVPGLLFLSPENAAPDRTPLVAPGPLFLYQRIQLQITITITRASFPPPNSFPRPATGSHTYSQPVRNRPIMTGHFTEVHSPRYPPNVVR